MHISDYVGDRRFDARNTIESRRRGQTVHRVAILFSADPPEFLDHAGAEQVEEELAELGLLDYCRPALQQRG